MDAGLSWSLAKLVPPAHDQFKTSLNQLKPASMLQNIPNQHMLFFSTELNHVNQ